MKKVQAAFLSMTLIVTMLLGTVPVRAADGEGGSPSPYGPVTIHRVQTSGNIYNPRGNGDSYTAVTKGYYGRNAAMSPRAVQLKHQPNPANNGRMLATFESGTTSKRSPVFPIFESTNTGETWTKISEVADTQNAYNAHGIEKYIKPEKEGDFWGLMNCPELYELPVAMGDYPAGTILCAGISTPYDQDYTASYTTNPAQQHTVETDPDGFLAQSKLELYASADLGQTWEYVSTIASGGMNNMNWRNQYGGALWEPFFLYNEATGNLVCYYSDENDVNHSQKLVFKGTHNITDWGGEENLKDIVKIDGYGYRPGMVTIAETAQGSYVMTYETVGAPFGLVTGVKYSDDPENWEHGTWGTNLPGTGGSPYINTLQDGRVAFNYNGSGNLRINTKADATGDWATVNTPMPSRYNRQFFSLEDGRLFIIGGSNGHITCATMEVEPFPDTAGTVHFTSKKSSGTGAIAVNDASKAEGKDLIEWTYNGAGYDHQWTIEPTDEAGYYKIVNLNSGLAIGGLNHSSITGTVPAQYTYSAAHDDMQWKIEQEGNYFTLVNKHGLYLSRAELWFSPGYRLRITDYDASDPDTHLWSILPHVDDESDIEIISGPDKAIYEIDEEFDRTGLVVGRRVSSDELKPIYTYLLSGFDSTSPGEKTITATFGSKTATFVVSVRDTEPNHTDKTALNTVIDEAGALNEASYTADSWATLQTALTAALAVAADEGASQESVDAATQALGDAMVALELAGGGEVAVEKIIVTGPSGNQMKKGKQFQFTAEVLPENATDRSVTWSSSNTTVLKITSDGIATATQRAGTTIVTATAANGVKATIIIRVS